MGEYSGIWVFAEISDNHVLDVTFELLGEAKKLSQDGQVYVFAAGTKNQIDACAEEIFSYGADRIYAAVSDSLKEYTVTGYTYALSCLIKEYMPEIVLMGGTVRGRELGPRIAARVDTGMTADCTRLDISMDSYLSYIQEATEADITSIHAEDCRDILKATKPAFGGNMLATICCPEKRPQMASVRPSVFEKPERTGQKSGEIIYMNIDLKEEDIMMKIKEIIQMPKKGSSLSDAEIIVAGGRGLIDFEGFELLREFAELIGASVGVSRSLVDNGWADVSMQIGQSGIVISPKLYINFGISGVVQHTAGILGSDVIVSVNNDPDAPIFEVSDYCIVGDAKTTLKALIDELK